MPLFGSDKNVRYAVVGLGWIAQEDILPTFEHAKKSQLVALVTDDPKKAEELGKKYEVSQVVDYDKYDALLRGGSIDAVYITLPNHMHKDFTVRAAREGIHVLCEKPMANSVAECEEMISAAEKHRVKLMIAYRLHFEPANLKAIDTVQSGAIGEPRIFSSTFAEQVKPGNIRLIKHMGGGPLMDLGVYQINAARYLFRQEPIEVIGAGASTGDPRFREVHEMASAILRFPGDRLAVFTCSFGASGSDSYEVVGTKGDLKLDPGFSYESDKTMRLKMEGKEHESSFDKVDQFGGEIEYFSECVLNNAEPEPNGREGLADLRIIEALLESMRAGTPVKLESFEKPTRPGEEQKKEKAFIKPEKKMVDAKAATGA
jgi:predicted dehydrogenase